MVMAVPHISKIKILKNIKKYDIGTAIDRSDKDSIITTRDF